MVTEALLRAPLPPCVASTRSEVDWMVQVQVEAMVTAGFTDPSGHTVNLGTIVRTEAVQLT